MLHIEIELSTWDDPRKCQTNGTVRLRFYDYDREMETFDETHTLKSDFTVFDSESRLASSDEIRAQAQRRAAVALFKACYAQARTLWTKGGEDD